MIPRVAGHALAILFLTTAPAQAQPPPPPPDPEPPRMVTVDNSPGMLYTGIGLTAAGTALGGTGTALIAYTAEHASNPFAFLGSVMMTVAGGALFFTGIPLWIAGEWDIEVEDTDPRARRSQASVSLSLTPAGAGLVGHF